MCEELNDEVENGYKLSRALVEHLESMGADYMSQAIETDHGCYIVKVVKTI